MDARTPTVDLPAPGLLKRLGRRLRAARAQPAPDRVHEPDLEEVRHRILPAGSPEPSAASRATARYREPS